MALHEIRVINHPWIPDPKGQDILYEIQHALGLKNITRVTTARVYRLEGINEKEAYFLAQKLLAEDIYQSYRLNEPVITNATAVVEVAYKPGVMNPGTASLMKAARDLGINNLIACDSSWEYGFFGPGVTTADLNLILRRLLVNETVEQVVTSRSSDVRRQTSGEKQTTSRPTGWKPVLPEACSTLGRQDACSTLGRQDTCSTKPSTLVIHGLAQKTKIIPLRAMNDQELMALSQDKLFLDLEEMQRIKDYFISLDRDPTDCEVETIAQTWSEHCIHKTFKAKLLVNGREKMPLLKRLQQATQKINHPLVRSAFVDNSGVFEFYQGWAICGKVETHNAPSAIEPYGGAMTGSGGVFRDIMGTGQGAKVIASTDIFCFAPPDYPAEKIPDGCLHPHYLLRRVVAGVRDYGNRMGIPTNNGSVHFHPDFRAKPTVIVGAYGILPVERCLKGKPRSGDLAIAIGGRTGRDGIHGATFSSGEMTARTIEVNASAVQIGHPIEEKRVADAILAAGKQGLIRAITDCGAGGFSSSLGEMGTETGVKIYLERAPLKYPGLAPWEIWVSESQERMVLAVDPEKADRVLAICQALNVEAIIMGEFNDDRRLLVSYYDEVVCSLDMDFLHHGWPQKARRAAWQAPVFAEPDLPPPANWEEIYLQVMAHGNVCSKEPIIRMYDHGVQGTCALPPFNGANGDAPNDAVILTPLLGQPCAVIISHGLNPVLNRINPYYGSLWAMAEAVANAVAVGANPQELMLIDNFIWPVPEENFLGALDLSVDACVDFTQATGMPFISGKDSLSSTYRGKDSLVIHIPPVLCISAFGRLPDAAKTVSADFKKEHSQIVLVGCRNPMEMAGSVYYDLAGYIGNNLPKIDLTILLKVYQAIHQAIAEGEVLACHDISEGGPAAALAEMCFGGSLGAVINIPAEEKAENFLFNETAGCFLVELDQKINPSGLFAGVPHKAIGYTVSQKEIAAYRQEKLLFALPLAQLKEAWQRPMKEVFGGSITA